MQDWWRANCRCEKVVLASALKRTGLDDVRGWMLENIPEGPTLYPKEQVSEQPEKFFVAEIMRERVFELYDQEIPYATQVLSYLRTIVTTEQLVSLVLLTTVVTIV